MLLRTSREPMQFGKYIAAKGILPSVAHTQAEFEDIRTAYEAGYTHATHFYNAMPGFHKRREYKYEGTVESIYLLDDMTVEVVADGIHVPPTILRLVYKIKGVERTCLITDALACADSDSKEAFDPRELSKTESANWPTILLWREVSPPWTA